MSIHFSQFFLFRVHFSIPVALAFIFHMVKFTFGASGFTFTGYFQMQSFSHFGGSGFIFHMKSHIGMTSHAFA